MAAYDYSFARPDPNDLDEGALRYLAPVGSFAWPQHSVGKVIGLDELQSLWAAGKPVGLVWEVDTYDFQRGYDGGFAWGQQARQMARTLGFPDDVPIYCAVDRRLTDATRGTAVEYEAGFNAGANKGRPYGEGALISACVDAGFTDKGWMPSTWGPIPAGRVAITQLVQQSNVPGTDQNVVTSDWGGYLPGAVPAPEPPTGDLTWLFPML